MPEDSPPDIVTRLVGDVSGLRDAFVEGKALAKGYREDVAGQFTGGKSIGESFGKDIAAGIQDAIPAAAGSGAGIGERIGKELDAGIQEAIPAVRESSVKAGDTVTDTVAGRLRDSRGRFVGVGQDIGGSFTRGIQDALPASLPDLIPPVPQDAPGPKRDGKKTGDAFVNAFRGSLDRSLGTSGVTDDALVRGIGAKGDPAAKAFSASFGAGVRDNLTLSTVASILDPSGPAGQKITEDGKKTGTQAGRAAGNAAQGALSPLIVGAFAAAASAGPGLLLAGTAAAVLGVGALLTKSDADLAAGYKKLGADASDAIQHATDPLIPALQASLTVADQGIAKIGPQLKDTFAAVAPDATAITGGLVSLVENVLPGVDAGLRSIEPYAKVIGDDFGKIGSGVGGLFQGLGAGAAGGTAGFSALATAIEHLLPDVGEIVGDLSGGLGPALQDTVTVLDAAGTALKFVADNLPPGAIRATADAVGVLYAAFKIGTLTKVVAEGTTFTQWLGVAKTEAKTAAAEVAALGAAEEATAAKSGLMAAAGAAGAGAIKGLGAAAELATGPLGLIIAGAGILGDSLGKAFSKDVTINASDFAVTMQDAAKGSGQAQDQITRMATFVAALPWDKGSAGITSIDTALTQLYQADPGSAATEFYQLQQALEADGKSAADVAKMFPQYTAALNDAKLATQATASAATQALTPAQTLTQAIVTQQMKIASSSKDAGIAAVTTLDLGVAQTGLSQALSDSIDAYDQAATASGAYNQALESLSGTTNSMLSAEASFTIALDGVSAAAKANGRSLDVNNAKGAENIQAFTGIASAADKAAASIYQNEVGTKGANVAFADANSKLAAEKQAFIDSADKAGFNKDQVKALADQLYKLPKDVPIDVSLNTSSAARQLNGFVQKIDNTTGTVQVYASVHNPAGGKATYDGGGYVDAADGAPVDAVVHGREYVLSRDMLAGRQAVDPRVLAALRGGGSTGGAQSYGYTPSGGNTVVNIYVQAGTVLSSTIQFQQAVTAALAQQGLRMSNQYLSVQTVRGLK